MPRQVGRRTKFTVKQVEAALRKARGVCTLAAAGLSEATGRPITGSAIGKMVRRTPTLVAVRAEMLEEIIDIAEVGIIKAAVAGDVRACEFILKTQGRRRGWLVTPSARELMEADRAERLEELEAVGLAAGEAPGTGPVIEGEAADLDGLTPEELIKRYREEIGTDA